MTVDDGTAHETVERRHRTTVRRSRFTIGQATAGVIGLLLVVVGGVAMARVGLSSLMGDTTAVAGIGHTLLLGLINLVVGLIFLSSTPSMVGVRNTLITMGTLAIAFGAVVWIEPSPFVDYLGDGRPLGVAYLVIGLLALGSGLATPTYIAASETPYDDTVAEGDYRP